MQQPNNTQSLNPSSNTTNPQTKQYQSFTASGGSNSAFFSLDNCIDSTTVQKISSSSSLNSLNSSFSTDISENDKEFARVIEYIAMLKNTEKREEALQELSKKKESFPHLAL